MVSYNVPYSIRSNSTVNFVADADPVGTDTIADENIEGFKAFLENRLQRKVLNYTLNPFTKLGDNWSSTLLALEVKLIDSNDSYQVNQIL